MEVVKSAAGESRVGESVQFTTRVANAGNIPLTNVRITDSFDAQLEPRESTQGWDPAALAAGQLMWIVPQLMPGEAVTRVVLCLCRQSAEAATSRVTVTTAENVSEVAQAVVRILPASGPPADAGGPGRLLPGNALPDAAALATGQLIVDISEFGDPIKIGEGTAYVITIKNNRSVADQDVVLSVELPAGLKFGSLSGPGDRRNLSPDGRTVQVNPIREMRPAKRCRHFASRPPASFPENRC